MKPVLMVWAGMTTGSVMFSLVAFFLSPGIRNPNTPEVMVYALLGVSVLSAAMSQVLPRIIRGGPEQSRKLVGFALAEAAVLTSGVLYLISGDSRAIAGMGVGFFALLIQFPRPKTDGETMKLVP